MEIERKWMVEGWPEQASLPLLYTEYQEQGYLHSDAPIVRIRMEARMDAHMEASMEARTEASMEARTDASMDAKSSPDASGPDNSNSCNSCTNKTAETAADTDPKYVLCFKSAGFLSREEIEIEISKEHFERLSVLAGHPLIRKVRRVYRLPDGLELEVNLVDEGLPSQFMYAEVEFTSEEQARSFNPAAAGLGSYLSDDVTEKPGQSMSAYWARTRLA